jgi:hypothetical protein
MLFDVSDNMAYDLNPLIRQGRMSNNMGYNMTSSSSDSSSRSPKLLDQLRDRIRVKHYSIRTEQAYVQWVKRYLVFHGMR